MSDALPTLFEDEGINIVLNTMVKRVWGKSGQSVEITMIKMALRKR